jgi:hypothetical protein
MKKIIKIVSIVLLFNTIASCYHVPTKYIIVEDADTGAIKQVRDQHLITKIGDTLILESANNGHVNLFGRYHKSLPAVYVKTRNEVGGAYNKTVTFTYYKVVRIK